MPQMASQPVFVKVAVVVVSNRRPHWAEYQPRSGISYIERFEQKERASWRFLDELEERNNRSLAFKVNRLVLAAISAGENCS